MFNKKLNQINLSAVFSTLKQLGLKNIQMNISYTIYTNYKTNNSSVVLLSLSFLSWPSSRPTKYSRELNSLMFGNAQVQLSINSILVAYILPHKKRKENVQRLQRQIQWKRCYMEIRQQDDKWSLMNYCYSKQLWEYV